VFLVACGDDGGVRPLPDAPLGQISVTVRHGEAPTAGATVYVLSPTSSLIATVTTDASGMATADGVVAGSSVTVRDDATLLTILDVEPGDELQFVTQGVIEGTQVPIQVRATTQPTFERYFVSASCGRAELATTSGTFYVDGCASADVLVDVQDDNYHSLESAYAPDQVVTAALDLSALVYSPTLLQLLDISNAPESWHDLHLYRSLWTAKGPLYECRSFGSELRCATVPGASVLDRITAYDDTVWHEAYFPSASATTSVDLAGLPIATIPEEPTIDLATHVVRWTGGAGANIAQVTLSENDGSWTVYGPAPSDGHLQLPRLPEEVAGFTPDVHVHLTLLEVIGAYPAVRQRVFALDPAGLVTLTGDRVITASYEGGF
jgi:hypothetical protein